MINEDTFKSVMDFKIATIFRTARKILGSNQVQIAKMLRASQGTISKIEMGTLEPSAKMIITLSNCAGLQLRDFDLGFIDYSKEISVKDVAKVGTFKSLPETYHKMTSMNGRGAFLYNEYFKKTLGTKSFSQFLSSNNIDEDYFNYYGNQINANYVFKIVDAIKEKKGFGATDLTDMLRPLATPAAHGVELSKKYANASNSLDVVKVFLKNSKRYSRNFGYSIEDEKNNCMDVKIVAEDYFKDALKKNGKESERILFFQNYHQGYFQNLSCFDGKKGAKVEIMENNEGLNKCILRINGL